MVGSKCLEKAICHWLGTKPWDISRRRYPHYAPGMGLEGREVEMTTLTQQLHRTREHVLHFLQGAGSGGLQR